MVGQQVLADLYLDYSNNYISVEAFARAHHLQVEHAEKLIELGREVHNRGSIWS
jgi:hypothetical protein